MQQGADSRRSSMNKRNTRRHSTAGSSASGTSGNKTKSMPQSNSATPPLSKSSDEHARVSGSQVLRESDPRRTVRDYNNSMQYIQTGPSLVSHAPVSQYNTIPKNRCGDFYMRKLEDEERRQYGSRDDSMGNSAASGYMLDFTIFLPKIIMQCTMRLSACDIPNTEPLLKVLHRSQELLNQPGCMRVKMPRGVLLQATYPCGLGGRNCSGALFPDVRALGSSDEVVPDMKRSIHVLG